MSEERKNKSIEASYIAIEGPIGVGKTTLAKRLAETFKSELILERADENPFLDRFYEDANNAALPTQLFFLFQRSKQLEKIQQGDMFSPGRVADFIFEKDSLFAELNLDNHEFELYKKIRDKLDYDIPIPDLVIYLQAPADVLLRRVSERDVPYEKKIEKKYLEKIGDAYAKFFYGYNKSPLLIINSAVIDPIHKESDYQELLGAIKGMGSGRHFFNPTIKNIV
ncbi:MAG: deoxynucleoside kinase [Gammaproteobacteria bacterium TMED78]|nr:MAG: deoxynucleoside kinase [Gammaproteobacteria bacterium TMED78]|tara:strand:- start:41364 stop:42035 length:672 start_codon:yes stop_codon:yes gene_type:complete